MLKLQPNKSKKLTFDIEVGGIQHEDLSGFFRFDIDGIEYGLPLNINKEKMTVDLPPLNTIVSRQIQEHETIDARVDITANGYYISPWKDSFKVSNPISIQSKLVEEEEIPEVRMTITEEEQEQPTRKQQPIIKETKQPEKSTPPPKKEKKDLTKFRITKEQIFDYMERNGTRNPTVQEIVYNSAVQSAGSPDLIKIFTEIIKQYKKKDIDKLTNVMRKK
jgi:hypothetical protein